MTTITHFNDFTVKQMMGAIQAVVNLHTEVQSIPKNRGKSGLRSRCTECGFVYPCPTIDIIEDKLNG